MSLTVYGITPARITLVYGENHQARYYVVCVEGPYLFPRRNHGESRDKPFFEFFEYSQVGEPRVPVRKRDVEGEPLEAGARAFLELTSTGLIHTGCVRCAQKPGCLGLLIKNTASYFGPFEPGIRAAMQDSEIVCQAMEDTQKLPNMIYEKHLKGQDFFTVSEEDALKKVEFLQNHEDIKNYYGDHCDGSRSVENAVPCDLKTVLQMFGKIINTYPDLKADLISAYKNPEELPEKFKDYKEKASTPSAFPLFLYQQYFGDCPEGADGDTCRCGAQRNFETLSSTNFVATKCSAWDG